MNRKQRRAQGGQQAKPPSNRPPMPNIVHAAAIKSAEALLDQEKWGEAKALYEVVLKEDPRNLSALYNYGLLLADVQGSRPMPEDFDKAGTCFTSYLQQKPDDGDAMAVLAIVRMGQGKTSESLALMERARQYNPSPKMLERIGSYYLSAGDVKKSTECMALALKKAPKLLSAYYSFSSYSGFGADDPAFHLLQSFLPEEDELTAKNRVFLHFALAKSYLGQGDSERSFHHFAEGNRHKRASYSGYDVRISEKHAANVAALFTGDFVERFRGSGGHGSDRPIFIVGMPRSGSTLVDQILSSHPSVSSVGESPFLSKSLPSLKDDIPVMFAEDSTRVQKLAAVMSGDILDGAAKRYLSLLKAATPATPHVVDKNLFNYLWVGLIRLALPNAKIVHCTRDPHDIGLSIWQLLFHGDMPWAYDLEEIGRYYKSYKKLMAHWNRVFPGEIYEVNYETMVSNQEEETRKLLEYCGLPFDERCLRFHETKRHVQTASHSQVRKPIYRDSMAKWKKYEQYLGPLIKALEQE